MASAVAFAKLFKENTNFKLINVVYAVFSFCLNQSNEILQCRVAIQVRSQKFTIIVDGMDQVLHLTLQDAP